MEATILGYIRIIGYIFGPYYVMCTPKERGFVTGEPADPSKSCIQSAARRPFERGEGGGARYMEVMSYIGLTHTSHLTWL